MIAQSIHSRTDTLSQIDKGVQFIVLTPGSSSSQLLTALAPLTYHNPDPEEIGGWEVPYCLCSCTVQGDKEVHKYSFPMSAHIIIVF